MAGTRVWRGRVKPEARDEHERFVGWLGSDEARLQFRKFLLSGYSLAQQGDDLMVTLSAEEPPPIIRFLRNGRMWPDFWEYVGAGPTPTSVAGEPTVRVRWSRADEEA
jgi:hypothetical protein